MGSVEPDWQPISMLATIASLSDEGLRDAREHYATLLEARTKPHVLDDATIARTKRVNGESLEWSEVYDHQLARWQRERLTAVQREEVAWLQDVQRDLRAVADADPRARRRAGPGNDRAAAGQEILSITAHVLRHTFATRLVRGRTDLVIVAELLGHARLETTRAYRRPTQQDAIDALQRLDIDR